mmetsp:Transcript_116744/g.190051  ORF Transcript_116744/g.190051 Transcript_116744/m.190051 type:complete len:206 (-) Transcript_116744:205-822(-)
MAQYMKSDGEEQVCWDRQLSAASTTLPSSPPMSRMVSPEGERKVNEFKEEIKGDGLNFEFNALPDEVYNAAPSKEVLAFLPVLCGLFDYGLLKSMSARIISSFYDVCVYMSFLAFIGTVAILMPWALMLLPPIYLCLRDDHRTEDCEEEDSDSQKPKDAPASSFLTLGFSSLFGTCIYTIISVFVGGVAILAIILPTALVFCLQD